MYQIIRHITANCQLADKQRQYMPCSQVSVVTSVDLRPRYRELGLNCMDEGLNMFRIYANWVASELQDHCMSTN